MISHFLAAIQKAPPQSSPSPQPTPVEPQGQAELIRDIVEPLPIPTPAWQWGLIIAGVVLIAGLLAWLLMRWYKYRPVPPPPSPRSAALRDLEALRSQIRVLDPYQFSIVVSDVLRTYAGRQFHLPAREQTSPEFLAEIGVSPRFTPEDRKLLGHFLEHCDLIKFARVQADERASEELLGSAVAFVKGDRT